MTKASMQVREVRTFSESKPRVCDVAIYPIHRDKKVTRLTRYKSLDRWSNKLNGSYKSVYTKKRVHNRR